MKDLLETVLQALSERKGEDIRIYDMAALSPFLDKMVICSTNNLRMNNSLVQNLKDRLKEAGYAGPFRVEGRSDSRWQLADLGSIVVHIFVKEERDFYGLDNMYADVYERSHDV